LEESGEQHRRRVGRVIFEEVVAEPQSPPFPGLEPVECVG
jgi:hypothetical protein